MSAITEIMNELSKEFDLTNEKEFKKVLYGANKCYRIGILSKKLFWLTIVGLYLFKHYQDEQC